MRTVTLTRLAVVAAAFVATCAGAQDPARDAAKARAPKAVAAAPAADSGRAAGSPAAESTDTLKRIRDTGVLRLGVREASFPFSFLDAKGEPQGYSIDLCLAVADALRNDLKLPRLEIKYVTVSSSSRIPMVKEGKVDLECGSTTNTRDRQKDVAFAYTTFVAGMKMLAKKTSNINTITDLRGKTIVVTKGTTSEKMLRQLNDEHLLKLTFLESPDHDSSFKAIAEDRAIAFPMDDVLLYGLIAKSGRPDEYAVVGKYLSVEPYAIMLRKDDAAFERFVNRALTALFQSGEARRLYAKWFSTRELTVPMSLHLKESFETPNTFPAWP
jgi:glutamate/aspartate transport system substrate-binding protein